MLGISRWLDQLVSEWETTSVNFKRDLETKTADQKAELVKDVLGLANTQASGQRWMIIGFEDKTRVYRGPPNPKLNPDHLEHLLSQYTAPMVAGALRRRRLPAGVSGNHRGAARASQAPVPGSEVDR